MNDEVVLDIRSIVPPQRHPLIFDQFKQTAVGQSFILINDHKPQGLYYQFQAELTDQFTWDYLEEGPDAWRVRIGRR